MNNSKELICSAIYQKSSPDRIYEGTPLRTTLGKHPLSSNNKPAVLRSPNGGMAFTNTVLDCPTAVSIEVEDGEIKQTVIACVERRRRFRIVNYKPSLAYQARYSRTQPSIQGDAVRLEREMKKLYAREVAAPKLLYHIIEYINGRKRSIYADNADQQSQIVAVG